MTKLWVVEMLLSDRRDSRWAPTVGVGITLHAAKAELAEWRLQNPDDKYRLVTYVRATTVSKRSARPKAKAK
jgi:hypothetical protein